MKIVSVEEMSSSLLPLTLEEKICRLRSSLSDWGSGFAIPPDSGAKTGLARFLSSLFLSQPESEAVIYISEWGVWPSSENLELFNSYRLAKGETRTLDEAQVHCFQTADTDSFVSILSMVLFFVWDAEVYDSAGKCLVSISHDEWLEVRTNDGSVKDLCKWAAEHRLLNALVSA